jgi:RNA polymerase sigma factor (TIGR02999 family)
VTRLLNALAAGRAEATDELWPLVYDELRRLAERFFQDEPSDHTLQPTALVNEVFLRLVGTGTNDWSGRAQFFAVAAQAMRRILIDHARRRRATKRGGDRKKLPLDAAATPVFAQDENLLALDEALDRLTSFDPQLAKLVDLHLFAGLTLDETARALDVAPITAKRMWKMAKGWLYREITKGD